MCSDSVIEVVEGEELVSWKELEAAGTCCETGRGEFETTYITM